MQEITAVEREGDRIACEILHGQVGGGSPLDAADVHALTCALDEVVDFAEEAANRLGLYRVEAAMDEAVDIAEVFVLATRELAAALESLADGAEVSDRLIEVHRLEQEADRLVRAAVAAFFVDGIDPMTVIRWKDILRIARGRRLCLRPRSRICSRASGSSSAAREGHDARLTSSSDQGRPIGSIV